MRGFINYYQGDLQFPFASIFCGGLHFREGAIAMLVGLTAPALPAAAVALFAGAPETPQEEKAKKLSRSIALMKRLRYCIALLFSEKEGCFQCVDDNFKGDDCLILQTDLTEA